VLCMTYFICLGCCTLQPVEKSSKGNKLSSEKYDFMHFGARVGFEAKSEVAQERFLNSVV